MTSREAAIRVIRVLRAQGHQAYLVGGCVRDTLLGREASDYDVATSAKPPQVMRLFAETWAVGAQFGVVLVPFRALGSEDEPAPETPAPGFHPNYVEVATFRNDGAYSDGRHPDAVRYSSSPEEDVARRDFTINGMMMDPLEGGRVLDFVGGREDLAAGVVRAIGEPERRFTEDKLRLLRAVRFAARFRFRIETETMAAMQRLSPKIEQVSCERVRDELTRMLTEGQARTAFELLDASGLLQHALPEIARMKGVEQPPQFHPEGDVFTHTLLMLEKLPAGASRTLAWGALLHDVGKPATFRRAPDRIRFDGHVEVGVRMAEELCGRMRFSNAETGQIAALVANHMKFPAVREMREATLKRFVRQPAFEEHLELHRIDALSSNGCLDYYDYTRRRLAEMPPEQVRPAPLLNGHDLIALGYAPGPQFKEMLEAVEDAQLEGRAATREQALAMVAAQFGPPASSSTSAPQRIQ